MGFVTPALLGGALLIGVPIVLHLVMRRQPQHLVFPALRFLQRRRISNEHRLRLRHLILLALRCAIIVLLALALARPTLHGAGGGGAEDRPIAAALVFDNSLRMEYQQENQTRLERAGELAAWLVEQLPADGPIAVVERRAGHRSQDLDRAAAELRVSRLATSAAVRPLDDALRDALDWLREKKDYRGEVYVFTDMAEAAWSDLTLADLKTQLDELGNVNLYLIDVGATAPRNRGLGPLRLSAEELTPGSLLRVESELVTSGAAAADEEIGVELYIGNGTAELQKRGQQVARSAGGAASAVEFSLSGLPLGTHQGFLRIVGDDALPADDVRYFTVEVRPPRRVLLLGESADDTLFLREALAPTAAAGLLQSKFTCQSARFDQFGETPLADFDAICLVDPPPLPSEAWQSLVDFAHTGGGVGVFLGRHASRDEMNEPAAQQLLPAKLRWQSRDATYLRPLAVDHPALQELAEFADVVPWSEFPVFKYWELESLADGAGQPVDQGEDASSAHVVAWYANGKPALVDRQIGAGRVLTMTTSVSDPAYDDPWNLLPTGPDPWPFLALANGIAEYLTAANDARLNYLAGQTAVLQLSPEEQVISFVLLRPAGRGGRDGEAVRQTRPPGRQDLTVATTDTVGNYRVRAGGRDGRLDRGFSVNGAPEVSQLERVDFDEVASALGKDRVRVARTREEIEVRVGLGRVGRELFPALILAMAVVLGAESWLSNRFYSTM